MQYAVVARAADAAEHGSSLPVSSGVCGVEIVDVDAAPPEDVSARDSSRARSAQDDHCTSWRQWQLPALGSDSFNCFEFGSSSVKRLASAGADLAGRLAGCMQTARFGRHRASVPVQHVNNVTAAMCCDAKLVDAAHVHTTHQLHHDATCVLTHGAVQFYLFLEYPVDHDDDWEAESPQLRPRSSRASLAHHHSIPTENARQVQQLRRATVDGPRVAIVQCAALVLMFLLMVRCKSEAQLCWQTCESSGTACSLLHMAVALAHMHAFL